ncbi:MAG: butyrate kinase [Firmicutes bacterium]|nr:butyrate kinase [Bacillota bacterium]
MDYRILVINPGSTSTKVAVYEDEKELFMENIVHSEDSLSQCSALLEQMPLRLAAVQESLSAHSLQAEDLSAVVGRGGMIPRLKTGAYRVDQALKAVIESGKLIPHASNMGALLVDAIAAPLGLPAIIYDAVSADDLPEMAKITGIPEIRRQSFCHVLNSRAMGRKFAEAQGRKYEDMNLLIAHLGGGISISAHRGGRIIDVITDDGGPFSPERAGSVPLLYIIDMCFSGEYNKAQVTKKQRGQGGLRAWLGTADCQEIEERIHNGDEKAALIYEAQAYQIAKGIGNLAPALNCSMDAILLTGGLAYSRMLMEKIRSYVGPLAPIHVLPGQCEMEALALGMLRVLRGEEEAKSYSAEAE